MRFGSAGDNGLVVAEQVGFLVHVNPHVTKGKTQIHNLFDCRSTSDEFGPVGGSFHGCLLLRRPINDRLVEHVQDSGHCLTGQHVVVKVSILERGSDYLRSEATRAIRRDFLSDFSVDTLTPFTLYLG